MPKSSNQIAIDLSTMNHEITDIEPFPSYLQGACAIVYTASFNGVPVVIKKMNLLSIQHIEFLRNEINFLKDIDHANIIQMIAFDEREDDLQYIMPRMPMDLFTFLNNQFDIDVNLRILKKVMEALDYLHGLNIIHLDLKPENILLEQKPNQEPEPKLCDFGLSIKLAPYATHAQLDTLCGSLPYCAPEAIKKQIYSRATDIFAWANIAYFLMTDQIPFETETDNMSDHEKLNFMMRKILKGEKALFPEYAPVGMKTCISKAWSHKENERPSASQILRQNSIFQKEDTGAAFIFEQKDEEAKSDKVTGLEMNANLSMDTILVDTYSENCEEALEQVMVQQPIAYNPLLSNNIAIDEDDVPDEVNSPCCDLVSNIISVGHHVMSFFKPLCCGNNREVVNRENENISSTVVIIPGS